MQLPDVTRAVDHFRENVHSPAIARLLNRSRVSQIITTGSGASSTCASNVLIVTFPPMNSVQVYNPHRSYVPIHSRRRGHIASTGRKFTKTVVLVSSDENEVPRGNRRQELHSSGAVVDMLDFYTDWSEARVREIIQDALGGILDATQPQPR